MSIRNEILERCNKARERIAKAIHDGDWSALGWNVALVLAIVMVAVALSVGVLALVGKILGTLLGKIFAVPLALSILGLSYKMNCKERQTDRDTAALEKWARQVYFYVRDSMYYVFRAVARRTNVQIPDDPSDIEMRNRFFLQGRHIVFQFYVLLLAAQDKVKFTEKLTDTMAQLHRDGRFLGITEDLVKVNGLLYCPLQVLNVEEHDNGYVVQIVFADEETIPLVERAQERQRKTPGKTLFDDED